MINFYIFITKEFILYCYCKEKIDFDKLVGADIERVTRQNKKRGSLSQEN